MLIDNLNLLWGDELKSELKPKSKLKIIASCFFIYAYEKLKKELEKIESFEFIFTEPNFTANNKDAELDKKSREHKEFYIQKEQREKTIYGNIGLVKKSQNMKLESLKIIYKMKN